MTVRSPCSSSRTSLDGLTPQHMQPGLMISSREATIRRTPSGASAPNSLTMPSTVGWCSLSPAATAWRAACSDSVFSAPTPSETPSIGLRSASTASTVCPLRPSARASVPDTVVLPTPPLPATAIFMAASFRRAYSRGCERCWGIVSGYLVLRNSFERGPRCAVTLSRAATA